MTAQPRVAVLDYGSGNVRSAVRAIAAAGADAVLTADLEVCRNADGLVVPGVGAFAACMQGLREVGAPRLIDSRLAGGRPVLGICVGMQVLFDAGEEHGVHSDGLGQWPGTVERLRADVLPHMGWNTVAPPADSVLFAGVGDERFYFVHSYAARAWTMTGDSRLAAPMVTYSTHGEPFVAAVENGALSATQFHPEKSGSAGLRLLSNWVATL